MPLDVAATVLMTLLNRRRLSAAAMVRRGLDIVAASRPTMVQLPNRSPVLAAEHLDDDARERSAPARGAASAGSMYSVSSSADERGMPCTQRGAIDGLRELARRGR